MFGALGNFMDDLRGVLENVFSLIGTTVDAMITLHDQLKTFETDIMKLNESIDSGNIEGLPIVQSIGMIRYIIGDPAFYFMYALVLFGCLFTLYKLVMLLLRALSAMYDQFSKKFSLPSGITNIFNKFLGGGNP